MTTTDKILDSSFMSVTPVSVLNKVLGGKTRQFSANKGTIERVGSEYAGTVNNINNTKDIDIIKDIINYLNTKCNTRYKHTTEDSKKHIRARLRDGYTKDDFFTVIDKKSAEWIGTEQEKYLRPATLFGTKFESYLNQKVTAKKEKTVFDEWRDA